MDGKTEGRKCNQRPQEKKGTKELITPTQPVPATFEDPESVWMDPDRPKHRKHASGDKAQAVLRNSRSEYVEIPREKG